MNINNEGGGSGGGGGARDKYFHVEKITLKGVSNHFNFTNIMCLIYRDYSLKK